MPLFIDYHQLEGDLTIDDVREAHRADIANQEKYGVKYLQFWVNEKSSMVFCLIEGPDLQACVTCHLASHGNTPCNIQEVEPGFLKLFMGEGLPIDNHHMTLTHEGTTDPAIRTFLAIDIRTTSLFNKEPQLFTELNQSKKRMIDAISGFNGRFIEEDTNDTIVGVFNSSIHAIRCARSIQTHLQRLAQMQNGNDVQHVAFSMAVNSGQPLTRNEGFFEKAILSTKRLSRIAAPLQIVLSANLKSLLEIEDSPFSSSSIRVLTKPEEDFFNELLELTEKHLEHESFNVNSLSRLIGISRPHLYRKITALTGRSPQTFIKELRMKKAWYLLKSKKGNISEVALDVGFSNPSYFSKIFHESYGCTPSELLSDMY